MNLEIAVAPPVQQPTTCERMPWPTRALHPPGEWAQPIFRIILSLSSLAAAAAPPAQQAADIRPEKDGSYVVTAKSYTALVSSQGGLQSLKVEGVEVLDSKAPRNGAVFPGKDPAASVTLQGSTVTAVNKAIHVDYSFDATGIKITTEGGSLELPLQGVTALVCLDGITTDGKTSVGDVRKVVVGKAVFGLDQSFHWTEGKLWPSRLAARGGKPEDKFTYRIECGVTVAPEELVTGLDLKPQSRDPYKIPMYAKGDKPVFELASRNLGEPEVSGEIHFVLLDQPAGAGKPVWEETVPVKIAGGGKLAITSPPREITAPGCYWMQARFVKDAKVLKRAEFGLLYDAPAYKPALTRPADFREFWDAKIAGLRATPFDEKLTENPAASDALYIQYDLEINILPGKRIKTYFRTPRKEGKYLAEVDSYWGSETTDQIQKGIAKYEAQPPGIGGWERGGLRVRVGAPQPDDSTYTRWVSRDDNNMLDTYLLTLRMADYLRSRKEVAGIFLFGASRSGAIMIAVGALDPKMVLEINVHVPTSTGVSWTDKPYQGWGSRFKPEVTAYFDPVNFAPDIKVPLLLDGGIYDNLAFAPGILATANWATNSPFVRWAIDKGGHGYFESASRPQLEKEMGDYLKDNLPLQPAPAPAP